MSIAFSASDIIRFRCVMACSNKAFSSFISFFLFDGDVEPEALASLSWILQLGSYHGIWGWYQEGLGRVKFMYSRNSSTSRSVENCNMPFFHLGFPSFLQPWGFKVPTFHLGLLVILSRVKTRKQIATFHSCIGKIAISIAKVCIVTERTNSSNNVTLLLIL